MAIQYINTGTGPNSGNGDSIRAAFNKVNENFAHFSLVEQQSTQTQGMALASSSQTGVTVTYTTATGAISFSVDPASTSTIGGVIVGDYLSVNGAGLLSIATVPEATFSVAGGGKLSTTVVLNSNGAFTVVDATTFNKGVVQVSTGLSVGLGGMLSVSIPFTPSGVPYSILPNSGNTYTLGSTATQWRGVYAATISGAASAGTTATTSAGVGYIGIPQLSTATNYTLDAADQGRHVYVSQPGQTITIPSNSSVSFPVGSFVKIVAGPSATTVSIDISGDTMYLAGSGTTGTRTLAAYGIATLLKVGQTVWFVDGSGLT